MLILLNLPLVLSSTDPIPLLSRISTSGFSWCCPLFLRPGNGGSELERPRDIGVPEGGVSEEELHLGEKRLALGDPRGGQLLNLFTCQ